MDLNSARSGGGFSPNPLSYTDIYHYFQLMSMFPDEWELDLLRIFDKIALDTYAKRIKKDTKT